MLRKRITKRAVAKLCVVAVSVGTVASTAAIATAGAASATAAPVVHLATGGLRGKTVDNTAEFLGIPYAAPPVGPLRWRAPQPAAAWPGARNATAVAARCHQLGALRAAGG